MVTVSICVPAFNASTTISMALGSLIAQTYEDWEAIVVDDGSTDDTRRVVERFGDTRIQLVCNSSNRGRAIARQVGLDRARGRFLGMLDADDWWYPEKLEAQVEVLERVPGVTLVTSAMFCAACDGTPLGVLGMQRVRPGGSESTHFVRSLLDAFPPHAPSLIRMEAAKRAGYERWLVRAEDRLFLGRILAGNAYAYLEHPLYTYVRDRAASARSLSERYWWSARAGWALRHDFPASAPLFALGQVVRAGLYRCGFPEKVGLSEASERDLRNYRNARAVVVRAAGGATSDS